MKEARVRCRWKDEDISEATSQFFSWPETWDLGLGTWDFKLVMVMHGFQVWATNLTSELSPH